MAIDIDLSSVNTSQGLATLLREQFDTKTNDAFTAVGSDFGQTVWRSGHNCSILTSVGGMVADAEDSFANLINSAAHGVESAVSDITKNVGEVIKGVETAIQASVEKVQVFISWLEAQADTVIELAKGAMQQLLEGLDNALNYVENALSAINETVDQVMSEMLSAVNNLNIRACETLSDAVKTVGNGAGIDNIVVSTVQPQSEFVQQNFGSMNNMLNNKAESLLTFSSDFDSGRSGPQKVIDEAFQSIDELIRMRFPVV